MKLFFLALLSATLFFPSVMWGQVSDEANRQDPRGLYKLMTLTAYDVEQYAPYDQYKLCTDSISLTIIINKGVFQIVNNEKDVLNYTGEALEYDTDTRTKIYNSSDKEFTLKWWCEVKNHPYFPYNSWCIEKYKAGELSDEASRIFHEIVEFHEPDEKNAFIGEWRILGGMDNFRKVKKQIKDLRAKNPSFGRKAQMLVFTSNNVVVVALEQNGGVGGMLDVNYDGRKSITFGNATHRVRWIDENLMAIEYKTEYSSNYEVYERITDGQSVVSRIADRLVK